MRFNATAIRIRIRIPTRRGAIDIADEPANPIGPTSIAARFGGGVLFGRLFASPFLKAKVGSLD